MARVSPIQLDKGLEEFLYIGLRDANSCVPDRKANRVVFGIPDDFKANFATLRSEFNGIAEKVDEHLFQPSFVRIHQCDVGGKVEIQFDSLLLCHFRDEAQTALADFLNGTRHNLK